MTIDDSVLKQELSDFSGSIDSGRNVKAGYRRGVGIEMGALVPKIQSDPDWIAATAASRGRSIVWLPRLMNLFLIIKYSSLPGNIIEYGSFNGGAALLMAALAKRLRPGCKVFALDTFEGMPPTDEKLDWHRAGSFASNKLEELENIRREEGLDNLVILKGLFQDTCPSIPKPDRRFFLSHVDCDVYELVRYSIRFSKKNAVPGSYLVFDDPLTSDCLGAMKAVEEELSQRGYHAEQMFPHPVYRYPPLGPNSGFRRAIGRLKALVG